MEATTARPVPVPAADALRALAWLAGAAGMSASDPGWRADALNAGKLAGVDPAGAC